MEVIDSQVHVWTASRPDRPWNANAKPHRAEPIGYEELLALMAAAGVHRALLVPPAWEGDRIDYCQEAVERHPGRFAIMGRIDLRRPDPAIVAGWMAQPGMLGMRLTFQGEASRHWLTDGTADWFWPLAEKAGIPVMVNAPYNIAQIGEIAARHPGLKLIVDHMGVRGFVDDAIAPSVAAAAALARHPNVFIKLSLAPTFSSEAYPYRNIHRYIRQLVEAYGARRAFWGSDLSVMLIRSDCTYAQSVTLFTEELDFLSAEERELVMGRALRDCLGWTAGQ